jgi:signal transduction histidine kinase
MERLHGRRGVQFHIEPKVAARAAVEAQDLSEMLANLVDNAGKWACAQVRIRIERSTGEQLRISVDDDGPGLPPESWEVVFDLGERLDERASGSGLGLAIVRDLAGLYGGRAGIEYSDMGGLSAVLELPAARS